jgi:endoplasmic reticulum junction formation protein lunapark
VLSTNITTTQARLEKARASSRRVRLLCTLYLSIAYLIYAIVVLVVIGGKNIGAYEWSGLAGGPVFIYLVRTVTSAVYDVRIDSLSSKLKGLQGERAKTIQKLKEATKYDSTLELLEKYGGNDGNQKPKRKGTEDGDTDNKKSPARSRRQNPAPAQRTTMPPPATANIRRDHMPPMNPATPQLAGPGPHGPLQPQQQRTEPSAEFAPNAFDAPRPQSANVPGAQYEMNPAGLQHHWYDRIMDTLLGEDETAAKNRIVLICKQCRLVNGQAAPGTTSLAEVGMWKCMGCGAKNGEENEGARIVKEVLGRRGESTERTDDGQESDLVEVSGEQSEEESVPIKEEEEEEEEEATGARKRKGKGKK